MNEFKRYETEHQRLAIVQVLAEDGQYSHNDGVLQAALSTLGHGVSLDRVRSLLSWLAEQELVTVADVAGIQVARLTARGLDAAQGRAHVPGVARPQPGG